MLLIQTTVSINIVFFYLFLFVLASSIFIILGQLGIVARMTNFAIWFLPFYKLTNMIFLFNIFSKKNYHCFRSMDKVENM